jgi:hypothetical protein
VGHPWGVEGQSGVAVFVEQDQATGAFAAFAEKLNSGLSGTGGGRRSRAEKIAGGFGEDHAHDGFTETGGRDGAGFVVGVAAATDERGIADASGKLATGAASGSGGEESALIIESDSTNGTLLVSTMMFGGVRIDAATCPGFPFGRRDEFGGIAKRNALFESEFFGATGDEHHVGRFFKDGPGGLNGILQAAESGDGASFEGGALHDDGVAFDKAVEVEMRAVAGVEDRIVFEYGDGGFDGVKCQAPACEHGPAGAKSPQAAGFAGFDGVVGDVPGTAVDDESGSHEEEAEYQIREGEPLQVVVCPRWRAQKEQRVNAKVRAA